MKLAAHFISVSLWLFASPATYAVLVNGLVDRPFIERIPVPTFISTEARLNQSFSKSSDLVVCRVSKTDTWSVVALRRVSAQNYELIVTSATNDYPDQNIPTRKHVDIPAAIAQQIEKFFELVLTRRVFPPSGRTGNISEDSRDRWIFLRVNETQGIAGVAQRDALHQNSSAAALAFHNIWWQLSGLVDVSPENREDALTELDRVSARYVLTEEAKPKS